jgi:hypothetical protein
MGRSGGLLWKRRWTFGFHKCGRFLDQPRGQRLEILSKHPPPPPSEVMRCTVWVTVRSSGVIMCRSGSRDVICGSNSKRSELSIFLIVLPHSCLPYTSTVHSSCQRDLQLWPAVVTCSWSGLVADSTDNRAVSCMDQTGPSLGQLHNLCWSLAAALCTLFGAPISPYFLHVGRHFSTSCLSVIT